MQIQIQQNQKEIKEHGSFDFPVHISEESISHYEGGSFLWHWHPEIEFTWIMEGQIDYRVNEKQYILHSGEGLFCNANALHSGYMTNISSCSYLSVTFHPRFIYGYEHSLLQTKYVNFITACSDWSSLKLSPDILWQFDILDTLKSIYAIAKAPEDDYEIQLHIMITQIWQMLYLYFAELPKQNLPPDDSLERLKTILSFIQTHYQESITLEEIAATVNICKSECCRFFKKHMHMTLFEYLMFFRIQQSITLLQSGSNVAEAGTMSGFSDPCYYGKIFKRYMNCSPGQYKKMRNPF